MSPQEHQEPYLRLKAHCQTAADLAGALGLMGWDRETFMPRHAADRRAGQMATLAGFHHEYILKEIYPLTLTLAEKPEALSLRAQNNVLQLRRSLDKTVKLPVDFVSLMARKCSEIQFIWDQAYKAGKYADFAPALAEMFELKKREADYYDYTSSPYDALLDSYEPGLTVATCERIFNPLKSKLRDLISRLHKAKSPRTDFLNQKIPASAQISLTEKVLADMGFDFGKGRQDVSTHPFTTSFAPEDVRITTRTDENDLSNALYSSIHEGGHALYEQGLNPDEYGLPGGEACSLSIHESQSRIWENNVGRSLPFLKAYFPQIRELFPDKLAGLTAEDLFKAYNTIEPSFIRTSADELTYHFHVLIRYETERAVMEGNLSVKELPDFWNAKMKEYLGIEVKNDLHGPLQDVHWSSGAVGYFPTYSLGSFYAAQFYHFALRELPDLESEISAGQLTVLTRWLNEKVHSAGRLYDSETLCERITGEKLNPDYFIRYITAKMEAVYGL